MHLSQCLKKLTLILDIIKVIKWHKMDIPPGLDNAFFSRFVKLWARLNCQAPVKQKETWSNTFEKQQIKYMSTSCCTEWECQTCQNYRHFLYQVARLLIKTYIPAQHKSSFHSSDASDLIITIYNSIWIRKQKSPLEVVSVK